MTTDIFASSKEIYASKLQIHNVQYAMLKCRNLNVFQFVKQDWAKGFNIGRYVQLI